jgi:CheY-like chemotaxis protein
VLVVDDEADCLRSTAEILRRGGYDPLTANGPLEALEALDEIQSRNGNIDLLLTDVVMPEMDGLILAQRIVAQFPGIRVLLMSGYTNEQRLFPLLPKPFGMKQLLEAVSTVLDG